MRRSQLLSIKLTQALAGIFAGLLFTHFSIAAEVDAASNAKPSEVAVENPDAVKNQDAVKKSVADKKPAAPAGKKMVQDATINLQTTVTGNQEQPRVLYILPWQSPQMENVDFEMLDSQQKAVFGHVEREELRREMESAGEL